jgi:hypothetical protein
MNMQQIEQIISLRAKKLTYHQISHSVGCCTRTVLRVLNKYQVEFAAREYAVMEASFEKTGIANDAQSYYHGALLKRLEEEFNQRNLANTPTDKLVRMIIAARKSCHQFVDRNKQKLDESVIRSEEPLEFDEDQLPLQPKISSGHQKPLIDQTKQELQQNRNNN